MAGTGNNKVMKPSQFAATMSPLRVSKRNASTHDERSHTTAIRHTLLTRFEFARRLAALRSATERRCRRLWSAVSQNGIYAIIAIVEEMRLAERGCTV